MAFPTLKAVLFDLDGTLLDTAPDFIVSLNLLADEYKVQNASPKNIRETVSDGARALTTLLFNIAQGDSGFEQRRQRLLDIYFEHMGKHCVLFEGVDTLLSKITGQGINWGIITNKPLRFSEPLVKDLNLASPPAVLICPDHVTHTKPSPEPLLLACEKIACTPAEAIYIGDHKRDIQCGLNAGSETICAAYGYIHSEDDISQWQAHHVAQHCDEIWPIINKRLTNEN
ncbi:MAG: HAD-IA family hydrolase [Pseudomonadota bacterium]